LRRANPEDDTNRLMYIAGVQLGVYENSTAGASPQEYLKFLNQILHTIIDSGNDYIADLKGNQPNLFKAVKTNFPASSTYQQVNKLPGRIEKRSVSICPHLNGIPFWAGLKTLIRVESSRQIIRHNHIEVQKETRYYISSLKATAREFGDRIRGYWGVENKVHYVRSGNSRGG
jgi:predicted transposase YbfD/YdcC